MAVSSDGHKCMEIEYAVATMCVVYAAMIAMLDGKGEPGDGRYYMDMSHDFWFYYCL